MSWLFGRSKDGDDDEEDYSEDEEDYSSSGEESEQGGVDDGDGEPAEDNQVKKEQEDMRNDNPLESPTTEDEKKEASPLEDSTIAAASESAPIENSAVASEQEGLAPNDEGNSMNGGREDKGGAAVQIADQKEEDSKASEPSDVNQNAKDIPSEEQHENEGEKEEENPENGRASADKKDLEEANDTTREATEVVTSPESENVTKQKEDANKDAEDGKNDEEEVEEVTSTHEKRSLLVLAAEHDRVDILKAILADDSEDRDTLLNTSIPPLHISIAYGSTNAVQSLLRMGADPSIRPDVNKIKSEAEAQGDEQLVDIPNMGRFDNMSAWELAFGKTNEDGDEVEQPKKRSSWFGGGDSSRKAGSLNIAPSKLEGIRHAFTAEGLRCIGSDEVERLKQLLDSGMPSTIDIGGKNLYDWAVEMGALQCEELLRVKEAPNQHGMGDGEATTRDDKKQNREAGSSAVLDRSKPGTESLSQLVNRIDELESLSKALSSCLDNLAEEVSVCHGLLLMGGGASALASHVRSLKTLKENKEAELDRLEEAWENSEDELAYWVKESGDIGKEIAELMSPAVISFSTNENVSFEGTLEEEQAQKQQLKAQAAALENKIRKLRASITDLSEENTRDLEEVEKRGLSGGINLVRTLRDELREVEFTLNETKSAEAVCRAKIKMIQSKMGSKKHQVASSGGGASAGTKATGPIIEATPVHVESVQESPMAQKLPPAIGEAGPAPQPVPAANQIQDDNRPTEPATKPSEAIASGQSNAIALKHQNSHGYFTVDLWRILLRIIGLGARVPTAPSSSASNVMIV